MAKRKAKYNAPMALERIELKKAFPEEVKSHASYKGIQLYKMDSYQIANVPLHPSTISGKLKGIGCLSTTCCGNVNCIEAMQNPNSPCYHCFAVKTAAQYNSLREWLEHNSKILSERLLSVQEMEQLITYWKKREQYKIRFEAFGDIINTIHGINYMNIVKTAETHSMYFGIWTKLPHVWNQVFQEIEKPENVTFLYSCPELSQTDCEIHLAYEFIDCYFTVAAKDKFDSVVEALKTAGKNVNICQCATGSCVNENICSYCYLKKSRKTGKEPNWIVEKLR